MNYLDEQPPNQEVSVSQKKTLIIVPTYNERDNAKKLALEILELDLDLDLLFIDDNSPDGTGQIINELASKHENVFAVHRPSKLGIGSAHLTGIKWAYANGYTTLVSMDCDFTHIPQDLPVFLRLSIDSDIVIGSRYIRNDSLRDWSFLRRILTQVGHLLTRLLLGMKYDATGAFRVYRLDNIPLEAFKLTRSTGYSFLFESLYILARNGFSIWEVPIILPSRTYGHSKMRISDAFSSLLRLGTTFLTKWLMTGRYKIQKKPANNSTISDLNESTGWDIYWAKKKSPISWSYSTIATLYRRFLIKRNLSRIVSEHFEPGSLLIHAGCGSGQVDTEVSARHSVIALDLSKEALKLYDNIHKGSQNLTLGTIFSLPFASESVDGIYHLGVMEHFSDDEIQRILLEFNRVLKPSGKMVIFWPPKFGVSVLFLRFAHFILNQIFRQRIKLHPDEITLLTSKDHASSIFGRSRFEVEYYYFGIQDLFTYCMMVVRKSLDLAEKDTTVTNPNSSHPHIDG